MVVTVAMDAKCAPFPLGSCGHSFLRMDSGMCGKYAAHIPGGSKVSKSLVEGLVKFPGSQKSPGTSFFTTRPQVVAGS